MRASNYVRLALLSAALATGVAADEARVSSREQLAQAIGQARPGATILIAPGAYRGGMSFRSLHGTMEAPIVIAAADPQNPPVIEGGGSGFHLSSPAFVELRNLIFTDAQGNGLNIDDGGSAQTPAHDLTLRNLTIRNVGPMGNRDGIKLSGLVDFRVEGCRVERWGSGGSAIDMVGCRNGVIAGCTFRDARSEQANGVQAKGGSENIVVQRCRFENAGGRAVNVGGSTGLAYFRPKIQGFEAKNITVEDCEFIGGSSPVAFVGVDGATVRHNTIYRPTRWIVRILQENTDPQFVTSRNGRFTNNAIVFRAEDIRTVVNIGPSTSPETFELAQNVWHCSDRPADTQRLVRSPAPERDSVYTVEPQFRNADAGDLQLRERLPHNAGVRRLAEAN
jgi:hypothetical protein